MRIKTIAIDQRGTAGHQPPMALFRTSWLCR
jgi:hypothetical protein